MRRQIDSKIEELANKISVRIREKGESFTLFLGAGASIQSGIPSYWSLCKDYCTEYNIPVKKEKYIEAFKINMANQPYNHVDTRIWFEKKMTNKTPSIGYYHLANLIKLGVFKTIITTNFDNLLELALSEIMPISKFKVFVRQKDRGSDQYISEVLKKDLSSIKIVKLHGDLQSDIFLFSNEEMMRYDTDLKNILQMKVNGGCIIVGSELDDKNVQSIFENNKIHNIYVNNKNREDINSELTDLLKVSEDWIISDKNGDFDSFFTDFDLSVQKKQIKYKTDKLIEIRKDIIKKEGKGVGYINDDRLEIAVGNLYRRIEEIYRLSFPDIIFFINDPTAPGGIDLMKRMTRSIKNNHPNTLIKTIDIQGNKTIGRHSERQVTSEYPQININSDTNILVLDSISFSGKTMKLAIEKLKEWYNCEIKGGILYIGLQLKIKIDKLNDKNYTYIEDDILLKGTIYHKDNVTDRHEIFFPWGMTQATDECKRVLLGTENDHTVRITKKPWGAIERFTEQENSSVRILTIESDQKLSFQRHLVRDEFFVALDENVGLEICEQSLEEYLNLEKKEVENRLLGEAEIKSLILEKGDYVLIPRGIWHRFKASKARVRLLEIAYGVYDERLDIERLIDKYDREYEDGLK